MKKNKISIFIISLILIAIFCLDIFAIIKYEEYTILPPEDLGNTNYYQYNYGIYSKFYIKIDTTSDFTYSPRIYCINGDLQEFNLFSITISVNNNKLIITNTFDSNASNNAEYVMILIPELNIDISSTTYYIPVYTYNAILNYTHSSKPNNLTYYLSSTTDINIITHEAFNVGYTNGYNNGYVQGLSDYPGAHDDWNLVQHMQYAIGFFIGDEYAQYVTPFAIAFTILMAYFIFIRWIFLFGKSQKALRVADIVVIVACICVMSVMYINMLTINIQNINISESVESSSEVIRSIVPDYVYKYIDDTKIDSVYKIVDDVRIGG